MMGLAMIALAMAGSVGISLGLISTVLGAKLRHLHNIASDLISRDLTIAAIASVMFAQHKSPVCRLDARPWLDKHGLDKHGLDKHGLDKHGLDNHGLYNDRSATRMAHHSKIITMD
jgi:hypothetical protein